MLTHTTESPVLNTIWAAIIGPSGVGKNYIDQMILCDRRFVMPRSWTTRAPRDSDGVGCKQYHYTSHEEFEQKAEEGFFLEFENNSGHFYGTPKHEVEGNDVLFEVDSKGALKLAWMFPHLHTIFILPDSIENLVERLKNRGTETSEEIERRLRKVPQELAVAMRFRYRVVNREGKRDETVQEIMELFLKLRAGLPIDLCQYDHSALVADLYNEATTAFAAV